ncbi:hypothetical protein THAOC_04898 [Thalassiosira oceanica]|uniref:DOT1 domain-containing protein n=1 Tax=Thalassiosira oceanica TaxID=159749 RepID=K0TNF3_THAOC|nr:hypothetical protein THAOC_04898 [Thalassiosira oceanica]|eukprot:EJK73477.1 hypothetical protein THAOC_04898 [Thalassiosira oceanica]
MLFCASSKALLIGSAFLVVQSRSLSLIASKSLSRDEARHVVDHALCPIHQERERNLAALEAYGGVPASITNDDPRTEYTYGEFPYNSVDLLVDRSQKYVTRRDDDGRTNFVDLGSGSGRLVFYQCLTRRNWETHGIEISQQFHDLALGSCAVGQAEGFFGPDTGQPDASRLAFHNGNALGVEDEFFAHTRSEDNERIQRVLSTAHILFAYSSVWETERTQPFSQDLQAMILSSKWSERLAEVCPQGCVAITTDRALSPDFGWKLVDRADVENPSLFGSTGFISVLEK